MTTDALALIEAEAERRARGLPQRQRKSTKDLAKEIGSAYGYVANLISKRRRELELKVDVPRETSTPNVNSEASE
jgi:hypothetical protein